MFTGNVDDALKFFALISQTIVEVHGENINEMESDDPLLERLNAALRLVFRGKSPNSIISFSTYHFFKCLLFIRGNFEKEFFRSSYCYL